MKKTTRFVGLDVHSETIAVAVAEPDGTVREMGTIPNRTNAVRRLVGKLGKVETIRACYEAGPTGYALYWELAKLGVACEVIAPTLVPVKAGDRVKTDRRDAAKLARSYRSGDLTPVAVPSPAQEALRDLVRAREAAKRDQLRARHRLGKFLLRHGRRRPDGMKAWTQRHLSWVKTEVHFDFAAQEATLADYLHEVEHAGERIVRLEASIDEAAANMPAELRAVVEALQAMRGIAKITAVTLATEVGAFSRFERATRFMSFCGLVPSEHSSGQSTRRGAITKAGNAHIRRVLLEAAWSNRHRPCVGAALRKRQAGTSATIRETAWKAQHRMHTRYRSLVGRGVLHQKVATALARELAGFVWAIAVTVENELRRVNKRAA